MRGLQCQAHVAKSVQKPDRGKRGTDVYLGVWPTAYRLPPERNHRSCAFPELPDRVCGLVAGSPCTSSALCATGGRCARTLKWFRASWGTLRDGRCYACRREVAMKCLCCGRPIEPRQAWRSSNGRFYCGGFCADSEEGFCSTSSEPLKTSNSAITRTEAALT